MTIRDIEKVILDNKKLDDDQKEFILNKADDIWKNHPDVMYRFPRWLKYIAWVAGYQLYDYNRTVRRLVEVPLDRNRAIIVNRLRPYVRTILSKLAEDKAEMSVMPNSTESEDIQAARTADKVIDGLMYKMNWQQIVNDVRLWAVIANRAFFRVYWNDDEQGVVAYDENGATYDEGDLMIESVSPFNVRTDPSFFTRDKWRFLVYGDDMDASDLEKKYKLKSGTLKAKSEHEIEGELEYTMPDDVDSIFSPKVSTTEIAGRLVRYMEFWTKKIWVFMAGSKVLDYGANDYKEIPFFGVEERLIPIESYEKSMPYNESLIKDAIPLQREYNRQYSLISLALERASKIKIMNPAGSLLSKKQWTNDYGVFVDYSPMAGGTPFQAKLEPFPLEVNQYKADLSSEMERIMSLSPVSFGQLPERASHASGALVNILLEQDDAVLTPLTMCINHAAARAWSLGLQLVQNNYVTSRIVKLVGKSGSDDVVKFQGSDIKGNTDVRVVTQAGLPKSKALRIEYIMKLREMGLLQDNKTVLGMLEFGNPEKLFQDEFINEQRAYREDSMIEKTVDIDPKSTGLWVYKYEDFNSHLKIHLRFRMGIEYEKLKQNQQQALDYHIDATIAAQSGKPIEEPPLGAPVGGTSPNEPGESPLEGIPPGEMEQNWAPEEEEIPGGKDYFAGETGETAVSEEDLNG